MFVARLNVWYSNRGTSPVIYSLDHSSDKRWDRFSILLQLVTGKELKRKQLFLRKLILLYSLIHHSPASKASPVFNSWNLPTMNYVLMTASSPSDAARQVSSWLQTLPSRAHHSLSARQRAPCHTHPPSKGTAPARGSVSHVSPKLCLVILLQSQQIEVMPLPERSLIPSSLGNESGLLSNISIIIKARSIIQETQKNWPGQQTLWDP